MSTYSKKSSTYFWTEIKCALNFKRSLLSMENATKIGNTEHINFTKLQSLSLQFKMEATFFLFHFHVVFVIDEILFTFDENRRNHHKRRRRETIQS